MISNGNCLPVDSFPETITSILHQCWQFDPEMRPNIQEIGLSILKVRKEFDPNFVIV